MGSNVKVGYYAQYRVRHAQRQRTRSCRKRRTSPIPVNEQSARTVLGSFLFRGDDVFKTVAVLSGGEKSRLALVKLLLNPPNLLLMDEPTTHLDMASIDALIGALDQYEGTLVFICHDVHFIRALAKKVLHIDTGKLTPYAGGYDYYLEKRSATDAREALIGRQRAPRPTARAAPVAATSRRGTGRHAQDQGTKTRRGRGAQRHFARETREREERVRKLEREIANLETRQKALAAELEDETIYQQPGRPMQLNRELTGVTDLLARLTREWEANAERLQAEASLALAESDPR